MISPSSPSVVVGDNTEEEDAILRVLVRDEEVLLLGENNSDGTVSPCHERALGTSEVNNSMERTL